MPAATSLEDIYRTYAGSNSPASLSASYSPSTNYQLAGFYMRAAEHLGLRPPCLTVEKPLVDDISLSSSTPASGQINRTGSAANRNQNVQRRRQRPATGSDKQLVLTSQQQKISEEEATYHQQQQKGRRSRRQRDFMAAGSERRESLGPEALLFVYHDEELSCASAPDSFLSPTTSRLCSSNSDEQLQSNQSGHLTIEELRVTLNSCWLCGCNWQQDHVSLDCPECGGYALTRPCANCDGQCQQVWRRNINGSHDYHKALWLGECHLEGRQPDCCQLAAGSGSGSGATSSAEARLRAVELRSDDDDSNDGYSEEEDSEDDEEEGQFSDDDGIQVAFGAGPSQHCDE